MGKRVGRFYDKNSVTPQHKRRRICSKVQEVMNDIHRNIEFQEQNSSVAVIDNNHLNDGEDNVNFPVGQDGSVNEEILQMHNDNEELEYHFSSTDNNLSDSSCTSDWELARHSPYYTSNATHQDNHNDREFRENNEENLLSNKIKEWALETGTRGSKLTLLLKKLREGGINTLPSDGRTLLKIRRNVELGSFSDGQYYYFGCEVNLRHIFRKMKHIPNVVQLKFNIDGVPLFKSDQSQFWCIVGATDLKHTTVFPVAIFSGKKKPNLDMFLNPFVLDLNTMVNEGINIGSKTISFKLGPIMCDAPAKAYVKRVVQYSGYFGCDYCVQKGEYVKNVVFPLTESPLRTNQGFRNRQQPEHHKGISPFEKLTFVDMIQHFVHDSLHLICLGVCKRLVNMWFHEPKGQHRIRGSLVAMASSKMLAASEYKPLEFNRSPRSFQFFKLFKGHEWQHIVLYYGMVVFKNVIPSAFYDHFLLLHAAIYILSCNRLLHKINLAETFLQQFVENGKTIYGIPYMVYNTHSLVHLCTDVRNWGSLPNFSAYPFESFLGKLKSILKKPNFPLSQVVLTVLSCIDNKSDIVSIKKKPDTWISTQIHNNGPTGAHADATEYKKLEGPEFTISCKNGDNIIMSKSKQIILVENILKIGEDYLLLGKKFNSKQDFYKTPIKSSILDIYRISDLDTTITEVTLEDIRFKMCITPLAGKDVYAAVPLSHL